MMGRFVEEVPFSAASIPTGKLQRAKTFFGLKEKLQPAIVPYEAGIVAQLSGSPGFQALGNRQLRKR